MLKLKVGATAVFQTLLILIFIVFVSSPAMAIAAAVGDVDALFLVSTKKTPAQSLEPTSERARLVEINFAALAQAETLTLNFFDDAVFTAVKDRVEQNRSGSYTWIGFFDTPRGPGQAILVVRDEIVVGHINAPDGEYVVRPALGKTHLVLKVGETAVLGTDHYDILPGLSLPKPTTGIPTMAPTTADDGSVIDVLVVYTDDAVAAQGVPTLESLIDLYMAYTNQAYVNSNISQRVDLVYTGEINYSEPLDNVTALLDFKNTGDGQLEDVHTLRNTYHADLNYLLVQNDGSSGCGGIAFVQTSVTASWQNNGFSVQEACSFGSGVFAHELGHNMGSNHDWYVDSPTTNPYSYAHGYTNTNPANAFRTIMSYGNHCTALGLSCTAIPNFSNPDVTYNGSPTGVADGTSIACTQGNAANPLCDADNRKTFNNTDSNTAGFRKSEITWLGNSTDWNSASNWRIYEGVYNALSPVNRVPRAIDDVVIPSSPTGGNFPTISSGTVNARNVTLATGATLNMSGGTLNVYGMWEEQGTGTFNGTGGTVIFQGRLLPQTVTATANSTFPNVQIGNGGSTTVSLGSNVDINGNLLLKSGAILSGGSYTLELSGNWTDEGNGFSAGTSTVILDGVNQTLNKVTTATLLTEPFEEAQGGGCGCNTSKLPSGWARQQNSGSGFLGGDAFGGNGEAIRWNNTTDGWLHTTGFALQPNVNYTVQYTYWRSTSNQTFSVYLGTGQSSGSMSTLLDTVTATSGTHLTRSAAFTVPTAGTYYLGLRAQEAGSGGYAIYDDISLTAVQNLTFYNLTIANSGTATFNQNAAVLNNLVVNSGATADFGSNDTTVEGSVTNNGTMQQSRNVSDGSGATTYEFLILKNAAGSSTKYYGVTIKPDGGQALGQTSVAVSGNQACTTNGSDPVLDRCYNITPTSAQSATIKYWYTNAELNGQTWNDLKLWDWHSSAWTELAAGNDSYGVGCGSDAGCWGQWTGVATFSPMVLGTTTAPAGSPAGTCSAPTAPTTMSMNTAGTQLTWSGGTADSYQVWRATNTPYFTPGANCASPGGLTCTANATSPLTTSASTVGTNYYYKIVAVNTCGSTATATGHKGAFSFSITPGTP